MEHLRRRTTAFIAIALALVLTVMATNGPAKITNASFNSTSSTTPWFGVLQPHTSNYAADRAAGLSVATLEIGWDSWEPTQGQVSTAYVNEVKARYAALRSAGFEVVLDAGLQYPPAWVFATDPGARFVNQFGDVYSGPLGSDAPNAVFSPTVRTAQATYLASVGTNFTGLEFKAIRVGGLAMNELRFPTGNFNGHSNSFWAFDSNAQAQSPVPGWRPGQSCTNEAQQFLDWYTSSLTSYGTWLLGQYRTSISSTTSLQILMPSWGMRPGDAVAASSACLNGSSRSELTNDAPMGLDWANSVPQLALIPNVTLYGTWIDAADQGIGTTYESPIRYLHRLAVANAMPLAGENTGGNSRADMVRSIGRVVELGMTGMMWMQDPSLHDNGATAKLNDYRDLIAAAAPPVTTSTAPPTTTTSPTTTAITPTTSIPLPPVSTRSPYRLVSENGDLVTFTAGRSRVASTGARSLVAAASGSGDAAWLTDAAGRVKTTNGAGFHGDLTALRLNMPVVDIARASDDGYWVLGGDGGVFSFGDAQFYGSTGAIKLNQPVIAMAGSSSGGGYRFVASDGGVFCYGDANFFGSTGNIKLNKPMVTMAETASGNGYWLVASDGGVFAFGDAKYLGSTGAIILNSPVVGILPTASGNGYWLLAEDGGVFSFGDAAFVGSGVGTGASGKFVAITR